MTFYRNIDPELKMHNNWKIVEKIYDGDLIYEDFNEMLQDLQNFSYKIITDDNPLKRQIGFKCPELNRSWHIDIKNIKKSVTKEKIKIKLQDPEGKEKILKELNEKPIAKKIIEKENIDEMDI